MWRRWPPPKKSPISFAFPKGFSKLLFKNSQPRPANPRVGPAWWYLTVRQTFRTFVRLVVARRDIQTSNPDRQGSGGVLVETPPEKVTNDWLEKRDPEWRFIKCPIENGGFSYVMI